MFHKEKQNWQPRVRAVTPYNHNPAQSHFSDNRPLTINE